MILKKYVAPFLILALTAFEAFADITTTVVGREECAELPASLGFMEKPQDCKEASSTLILMFSGEDIIGFDTDSLSFDNITVNGKDYSKDRFGEPTYKTGHFPKVTKDGKHAFLDVEIKGIPFGALYSAKATGNITLLTSSNLIKNATLEISSPKASAGKKLGPLEFSDPTEQSDDDNAGNAIGEAFTQMFSEAFGGSRKPVDGKLALIVKGHNSSIAKFEVYEGTNKLDKQGWMGSDDMKTMNFSGYQGGALTIKLDYWADIQKQNVSVAF